METKFVARAPYQYDEKELSDRTGLKCLDKSRTSQEFAEDVNINTIAHRFGLTGELPQDVRMVFHGDFTQVMDFRAAQDLIVQARESFDAMPASVRARFDNDPARFLDFTSNAENFDEAVKLGLVRPEVQQERAEKARIAREAEVAAQVEAQLKLRSESVVEPSKGGRKSTAKDQSST